MGIQASFLDNLEWRRAVKHFGGGKVDESAIVNAIVNAPSSYGLQPYKIIVVKNAALKEKLRAASYNQAQVTECDTLCIFCARTDVGKRVEEFILATSAEQMRPMFEGFLQNLKDPVDWAKRQAYVALGFGLAAAAEQRVASCPMEGFSADEVKTILNLPTNLEPCVYLALGEWVYDDESPRVRFPASDLLVEYN